MSFDDVVCTDLRIFRTAEDFKCDLVSFVVAAESEICLAAKFKCDFVSFVVAAIERITVHPSSCAVAACFSVINV